VLIPLANELRWGPNWKAAKKNGKPKPERSEAEVGKLLGKPRQTIARWTNISVAHVGNANTRAGVANTPPAHRITTKIPPSEWSTIFDRFQAGESQVHIAADYKVQQSRVAQIITRERKRLEKEAIRGGGGKAAGETTADNIRLDFYYTWRLRQV